MYLVSLDSLSVCFHVCVFNFCYVLNDWGEKVAEETQNIRNHIQGEKHAFKNGATTP